MSTGAAYTRGLSVLTGQNPEDSNLATVEAMQLSLFYPSVMISVTEL
jgi:hypothetical protein